MEGSENVESILYNAGAKGYGQAGASTRKRSLKGFNAMSGSPREDIDDNNYTIRQRSRMLVMSAPIATSAVKTSRTNAIGMGLKLNPRPDIQILGMDKKAAKEWQRKTKAEFNLWAGKKKNCDMTGINDLYGIQQLCYYSWLSSGDVFVLIKHKENKNNPYTLKLQVIEADRCSTPGGTVSYGLNITEGKNTVTGNKIYDGVEVDKDGAIVAYWFRNTYPYQMTFDRTEWKRVLAYGEKTGLPNVIHIMNSERPDQYRGVSLIAPVIESILQIRRYSEAEVQAAVIEAFYTGFVKSGATTDETGMTYNEVGDGQPDQDEVSHDPNEYELGPGTMNYMEPGEDIVFADPKRPASGFNNFVGAVCRQIGAALEIPADLLLKEFKASYSASRAALMEAWKSFKMYRNWFVSDFCRPVYEIWLSEAVARGRINAPGYFNDPLIREAWLGSEWIGPSQGTLDPVKEVNAEILAVKNGFTTYADATSRLNGSDWDSNMDQLDMEKKRMGGITEDGNIGTTEESDADNDTDDDTEDDSTV